MSETSSADGTSQQILYEAQAAAKILRETLPLMELSVLRDDEVRTCY